MNSHKSQRNNFNDLVRLSKLVSQRRLDQQFVEEGGRIIYVVDSDIVKLYSAPEDIAIDQGRRYGYCQFFKDSSPEQAKKLAIALSDYLFFQLSKDLPLLVFDAQLTEIDDICCGIKRVLNNSHSRSRQLINNEPQSITRDLSNILELAEKIDSASESLHSEDEETLIQKMEAISSQLYKSLSLVNEISRLNQILDDKEPKLTGVAYLLEHYSEVIKRNFFEIKADIFERSIIRSAIEEKLIKVSRSQKSHLRENDVSALSNLFFINKNLVDNKEKFRFVLISGDEKIVHASDVLNDAMTESFDEHCLGCSCGFAELYIRHPLSFINDEKFIGDLDYEFIDNVENELRELHGSKVINEVREFDDVASLMQAALPISDDGYPIGRFENHSEKLPQIFDVFLDKRLATYSIRITNYAIVKAETLLNQLSETKSGEEALREIYNEANNLFVQETNTLALNLQQEALGSHEAKEIFCYRIPPFLRFDKVTAAEEYIKNWVLDSKNINAKDLFNEIEKEDPSGYSITLCNAAIWAHVDDWKLVQDNAGRAFKIAIDLNDDGISNNHILFLGHEAAYLSVVASRHLAKAKTYEDIQQLLSNLRNVIELAKYLWDQFKEKNQIHNLKSADDEYRFMHELLSINLMEIWYDIFYFGLEDKSDDDCNQIIKQLKIIKSELFNMVNNTIEEIDNPENKHKVDYLRYAQRHAINNYCLVFMVLDKHGKLKSDCNNESIKSVLNTYKLSNVNRNPFKVKSYLHACTIAVASLLYMDMSKKEKDKLKNQMHTLLTEENINKYSKKPYEKQRFMFYNEIIGHQ